MQIVRYIRFVLLFLLPCVYTFAQCPEPSFTIPDTVCINEPFSITNTSTGATGYEWDFCSGDLSENPMVEELATVSGANTPADITTVFDGNNWFGFFFSRDNNLLFRLNFGNSLKNTPIVVNLGNLGGAIGRPEPITFVKEGSDWFAFTVNSIGNYNLIRLNFGEFLTSTPTVTDLTNFGGLLNLPRGLKIEKVNSDYIAVITNWGDNTLTLLNFGNSITNTLTSDRIRKTSPFSGVNNQLISTDLINDCGNWYGLTSSYGNGNIFKLSFGSSLFNIPSVVNLNAGAAIVNNPTIINLVYEQGYIGLIATTMGNVVKIDFGNSMDNSIPSVTNLGSQGVIGMFSLTLDKAKSEWIALSISNSNNKLYRLNFSASCSASINSSTEISPANIFYTKPGMHKIYYEEQRTPNNKIIFIDSVYVRPTLTVNFKTDASSNNFQAQYPSGSKISSFLWDFGDGSMGEGNPVQHNYSQDGNYNVTLTIQEVCGQTKSITKTVGVSNNIILQCPNVSFNVPDTICVNEPVSITNTSSGANRYEWDFCSGDLGQQPDVEYVSTLAPALIPTDITTVFDGSNWYGFVCSRNTSTILRLNFGNSLDNPPTITNLGNIDSKLNFPNGIKIVNENGNWYGLLVNVLGNESNNLLRLSFGNSLTNIPATQNITNVSAKLLQPRGIDIVKDNTEWIAVITNYAGKKISIINFGNSITNSPANSDIIETNTFTDELAKVTLIKQCSNWHAYVIGTNFYRLDFGSDLFSVPIINNITSFFSAINGISNIKFAVDENLMALAVTRLGRLYKINFGNSIVNTNPVITEIITNGLINDLESLELSKSNTEFKGIIIDWGSNNLVKVSFPNTCDADITNSELTNPSITYSTEGLKKIMLTAFDADNNLNTYTSSVFVRPQVIAGFTTDYTCLGSATTFIADASPAGNRIISYAWDFGNGKTASGKNATFNFPSVGNFPVKLTITDACGKVSEVTKQVTIRPKNTADFISPVSSCSNENIKFEDASITAGDVIIKWQWDFGDGQTSTQQSPEHLYTEAGEFTVSLSITGESGCTETITKSVTIKAGAAVDFTVENACLGNITSFRNLTAFSTGTHEVTREWSFGDNSTSTDLHPVHEYATTGTYTVTLTVRNNLDCIITKTKMITIRKEPVVDFSYALACTGETVNFFDESISTDGSIKTWQWNFGDTESGTNNYSSAQQGAHIFTKAGIYKVKLKVETIYGCVDSLMKDITVISSPNSVFTAEVDCSSKQVKFTDQSTFDSANPIISWYWDFGDNFTSREQHPIHTYSSSGNYTITLITTASSRCTNINSKLIQVYAPPIADFAFPEKICTNNQVQFTDKSISMEDPVISWQWDFGGFGSSNEQHPKIAFMAAQMAEVPVVLSITTASGCKASVSKNISLQALAEADFTYETVSHISPLSINFSSTTSNTASVSWNFGDGNTSDQPNPQHTYESGGIYNVSLTAVNAAGCSTIVHQEISVSSLSANVELKLETVNIVKTGTTTELQIRLVNSSPYILNELELASLINEKNTFTHLWQGELLPGKMLVYSYAIPEDISNNLVAACVTAVSRTFDKTSNRQCSSIENIFAVLTPYPNPVASEMYIPFLLPVKGEINISIIDILGRLQTRYTYTLEAGFHQVRINKGNLAAGIYLIEYNFTGHKQIKSIIIN